MPYFICVTCGAQYPEAASPPSACLICQEERQYVGWAGQRWTTHDQLCRTHRNTIQQKEPNLVAIGLEPSFGIGQRALLVRQPGGNVLWDCIPMLDRALVDCLRGIGGVAAIAISHPHYYTGMVEWSRAFDAPIYLHVADQQWVTRPDPMIEFWEGETKRIADELTLIRCGGHFEGGTVLHWPAGADGKGALLSGDIIQVVQDRRWVSFMHSYPNLLPVSVDTVERIVAAVEPYEFDRIYGAFWNKNVGNDAKESVKQSASRYIQHLTGS